MRDGRLYGRGACDMKGGIAAMVFAVEVLSSVGVSLDGDLLVATNTDEESSGAGGTALVAHGLRADAGVVTEPTGFQTWIACRGSEYGVITRARSARARRGSPARLAPRRRGQRDREGGRGAGRDRFAAGSWGARPGLSHPLLSPPSLLPTLARAGEWPVTYPASCELTIAVMYLPVQADAVGVGERGAPRGRGVDRAGDARSDDWLHEHPPAIEWWPNAVMPFEISEDEPIVGVMRGASEDVGGPRPLGGLDSWYDGATLTQLAGTRRSATGRRGSIPTGSAWRT